MPSTLCAGWPTTLSIFPMDNTPCALSTSKGENPGLGQAQPATPTTLTHRPTRLTFVVEAGLGTVPESNLPGINPATVAKILGNVAHNGAIVGNIEVTASFGKEAAG